MPRTKKTNESNVSLLSNIVPPDAPVNLDALGDLAKPITFPENKDSAENNTQVQTKRRGRKPKNATEPSAQEEAPKNAPKEKDFKPANEQSSEPHYQPPINIFDYAEKNSFDQSYEDNRSEAPIVDGIEAAERRQAKELGLEQSQQEAPQSIDSQANNTDAQGNGAPAERDQANGDAQQNANQQNNQQRQQFNNNNNGRFNNNNKFNKFNKFKNRRNRFLPQDEILDDSAPLPPPDPEKVAASRAKWKELRGLPMFELQRQAMELNIPDYKKMRKQALIYHILSATNGEDTPIYTEGVLEIMPEGYGFLRNPDHNYQAGTDDIYISQNWIRRFDLKMGDTITGQVRQPRDQEKYFALMRIDTVNFDAPEKTKRRVAFEYLTPIHPNQKLNLEWKKDEFSTRVMNLFTPIGKGQRGIILAPPRTGKTVLLQNIANAITQNHPEVKLIVLLIDERPEEVTDMRRHVKGEVIASTFDEPPEHHTRVADIVIEKAKRLVEHGNDVVILLDSITRFARANNVVIPHSGKILSGGVDANAMQRPKRFFGAARKIENGGSLTIMGTALIETGSRMDEVIFEEFKGTGNMELVLDRRLSEKRIWPAIDIFKSGTRKEELLLTEEELQRVWILRRYLQDMTSTEIMDFMISKMKLYEDNETFLNSMNK